MANFKSRAVFCILLGFILMAAPVQADNSTDAQERRSLAEKLERLWASKFKVTTVGQYHLAYRTSDSQSKYLETYMVAFYKDIYPLYFSNPPRAKFNVVYFKNKVEYEKATKMSAYGFYKIADRTLTSYAGSGHGTLWHEMMHGFIHDNARGETASWFDEGLASFYEMAFLHNGKVVEGYTNWRHPSVQVDIKNGDMISLKKFLEEDRLHSVDNGYAIARFLFCYLWMHDKMVPFVKTYLNTISKERPGLASGSASVVYFEKVFGKPFALIEADYKSMALKLKKNQKLNKIK